MLCVPENYPHTTPHYTTHTTLHHTTPHHTTPHNITLQSHIPTYTHEFDLCLNGTGVCFCLHYNLL